MGVAELAAAWMESRLPPGRVRDELFAERGRVLGQANADGWTEQGARAEAWCRWQERRGVPNW